MSITKIFAIGWPQGPELLIILVIVLLFFGGSKLPALMRSMGRGVGEFKSGLNEGKAEAKAVEGEKA